MLSQNHVPDNAAVPFSEKATKYSVILLRISIAIVFLWFGSLKFFPELSPAEQLASRTIEQLTLGLIEAELSIPLLALWEVIIGLGLLTGLFPRWIFALFMLQMAGTFTPLILFPQETWTQFPVVPTLEGQYILKNFVLISAALVVVTLSPSLRDDIL